MSGKCPGNFREISGKCPGNVREMSGKCPGNFRKKSGKTCSVYHSATGTERNNAYMVLLRPSDPTNELIGINFPEISRKFPGKFPGNFPEISLFNYVKTKTAKRKKQVKQLIFLISIFLIFPFWLQKLVIFDLKI